MASAFKVMLTGEGGFTGRYLRRTLREQGLPTISMDADITDSVAVNAAIKAINPDYVIHLAAISSPAHPDPTELYNVNVVGTLNLLDALKKHGQKLQRVILASSASIYGNQSKSILDETMCPTPVNHYGCSKLAMEHMAMSYSDSFQIIITRPFNYIGPGQSENFLVPKIVSAYQHKKRVIELGNLGVSREFNDVRSVCSAYYSLLEIEMSSRPLIVNLCSGRAISLMSIIDIMNSVAGYEIEIMVNADYVRSNEIDILVGCSARLVEQIGDQFNYEIEDTLSWIFNEEVNNKHPAIRN